MYNGEEKKKEEGRPWNHHIQQQTNKVTWKIEIRNLRIQHIYLFI